ncbi:hypothetical protein Kfla_5984 [Kribbella flavida DSM 17836]|uniref:Thioredoxin domain-containing protein n=1 Tax=Kribbella flavida (strain DSM 17836 / JCM 10339 / NBRC 14399) TaxID=479435 RepID=D2PST5_KRIFD|nr:hypothetical protein [Kribbella flavida]ADB34987.1 hypothetical protein Kfla_5984 [Kribbella flavida DSM 17836]
MTAGVVAVVLVVTAVNLLITFAVLRRLREHDQRLTQLEGRGGSHLDVLIGREPAPFAVHGIDGARVGHDGAAASLIGFFSVGCSACHDQAGPFRQAVEEGRFAGHDVLVVVDGPPGGDPDLVGQLSGLGVVVEGEQAQTVAAAYGVIAFPAFLTTVGGKVASAAPVIAMLRRQLV